MNTCSGASDPLIPASPGTEARHTNQGWALRLTLVAAILFTILLWLLSKDPLIERRLYAAAHPKLPPPKADIASLLVEDPPLGSRLITSKTRDLLRRSLPSKSGSTLLIQVGECSSCLPGDLKQWVHEAKDLSVSSVLVSTASPKHAAAFVRDRHIDIPVISDPDREVLASMNAVFAPRAYLISSDGRLLWVQKDPELAMRGLTSDRSFVSICKGQSQ